jgi:hypothetical protein
MWITSWRPCFDDNGVPCQDPTDRNTMKTYDQSDPEPGSLRSHPWTVATTDSESRYRDFKENPALVRTSLEDFLPWAEWPAVQRFYDIVEWINGCDSVLESNDCAFDGPSANSTPQFARALEVTGRLMVLWRALPLNLIRANSDWLKGALHRHLNENDTELEYGVVGITVFPVRYITLPPGDSQHLGFQLILSFWAWGDDERDVMANLERTISGLGAALHAAGNEAAACGISWPG